MQNDFDMEALNSIVDKVLEYKPNRTEKTKRTVKQQQVLPVAASKTKETADEIRDEGGFQSRGMAVRGLIVLILLFLYGFSFSAVAQDICNGEEFFDRVDSLNSEYRASRTAGDDLAAIVSTEEYHTALGELIDDCRNFVELQTSGENEIGSGTIDDPYAFNYFANLGQIQARVTQLVRPANQHFRSPEQGNEWVLLTVEVQCIDPEDLFCDVNGVHFSLLGDKGVVYDFGDIGFSDNHLSIELTKGGQSDGTVGFEIAEDDSDLRLMHGRRGNRVFLSAEPSLSQEEV